MAIMHPSDLENYDYTATEKEMYYALREQLPDTFHVFYSVRWFDYDSNNQRIDSECDFLVFSPSFGFLTIEVKGGIGVEYDGEFWWLHESHSSSRKLRRSPYLQAEESMRHFHKYYESEYNQKFFGVYGCAVAFPRYNIDYEELHEANQALTIDLNDMNNLKDKINEVFHYWKGKRHLSMSLSAEQREKFLKAINKRISISAAAGALIPIKEKEFAKIDFVQDSFLDILYNYKQVRVVGGAGTGKTFIAIKKALRCSLEGKDTLILCCNKDLIRNINRKIGDLQNVSCKTFDQLMVEVIGEHFYNLPVNENGSRKCLEAILAKENCVQYDSIIVDEAQDFDADMGCVVRHLLKDQTESELYIFYDENQNVFSKNFENAFDIKYPPFILRYNIRNTGCIYQLAVSRTGLGKDTIASNLIGVNPEIKEYSNKNQTIKGLTYIVNNLIKKEQVKNRSIVILSDEPYELSPLATECRIGTNTISFEDLETIDDSQICFKTTQEFKGLESDVVIYLKYNYSNIP